ncbi:uncharacterized protein B0H18DRAFT_976393, partial [Fomitopsis serialis]|uniref:uncharacterized protein n=1 Tax=Fomitopsis serialis TaxID=139415 RepID=UPI002007A081
MPAVRNEQRQDLDLASSGSRSATRRESEAPSTKSSHNLRVKEKTEEGLTSAYTRAIERWINDPEFSRWREPANYLEGKEGFIEWIEEVIERYTKAEMSIEDHWIVSIAAHSGYNLIYCNEPCLQDLKVIGKLKPNISKNCACFLADCAQNYQDSEADFFNHPAYRRQRRAAATQLLLLANIGEGTTLRIPRMRRARTCLIHGVMTTIDGDPGCEWAKKVTLSEDDFREIWTLG